MFKIHSDSPRAVVNIASYLRLNFASRVIEPWRFSLYPFSLMQSLMLTSETHEKSSHNSSHALHLT